MDFLKNNFREVLLSMALLSFLLLSRIALGFIDPTSGGIDVGWLQVVLAGVFKAAAGLVTLWLLVHAGFPTLCDYMKRNDLAYFQKDFIWNVTPSQRLWIFTALVVALLAFVGACLFNV